MNGSTSAKTFINPPNLLTALSLTAGFVALVLATQGEFAWAAGAVGVAALLDSVDGLLARKLDVCGPFGSQLDSLADMIAFGAAPALMLYLGVLQEVPVAGVSAAIAFVLCGAWRLARFPLIEEPHRFLGLPIPPAGLVAAGIAAWSPPGGLALALVLLLTALMVSEIPFPTLRTLGRVATSERRPAPREDEPLVAEVRAGQTAPAAVSPSPPRG